MPLRIVVCILCHCIWEVCNLPLILILQGIRVKRLPLISEETEPSTFKQHWGCYRLWDFWSKTEYIFALWYGYKPMQASKWNVMFWIKKILYRLIYSNVWALESGITWDGLEGVALLEEVLCQVCQGLEVSKALCQAQCLSACLSVSPSLQIWM